MKSFVSATTSRLDESCRTWELGSELWLHCTGVRPADCTDTLVSGGFEDGASTQTHQTDHVAHTVGIFEWYSVLVVAVGVGDDVWKVLVRLREQVLVVRQVRLILLGRCVGRQEIRHERGQASCNVSE